MRWDALLVVSFGGPDGPSDVMPFLRRVAGGRVPDERLEQVAARYRHFGGRSPISAETERLVSALRARLDIPVFLGCRFGPPFLPDAVREMRDLGVRRAAAFATSGFGSPSGCRVYREAIAAAVAGLEDSALAAAKLPLFGEHPAFIEAVADGARPALARLPDAALLFTAHSLPLAQATACPYERQVRFACAAVAAALGRPAWDLAWQSRSGPPQVPWLGPDVGDRLRALASSGRERGVVVVPIGFVSDHMEVAWDLDVEAAGIAAESGLPFARAATVGTHPAFLGLIEDLLADPAPPPDACGPWCCELP